MSAPSRVFALLFLLGCATAAPLTCVRRPDRAGWRDALDAQDGNKETGIPREVYAVLTTPEEMDASFYNENPEFARVLSEALFAVDAACAKPDFVVNPLEFPVCNERAAAFPPVCLIPNCLFCHCLTVGGVPVDKR
jgi:hypothetical protein